MTSTVHCISISHSSVVLSEAPDQPQRDDDDDSTHSSSVSSPSNQSTPATTPANSRGSSHASPIRSSRKVSQTQQEQQNTRLDYNIGLAIFHQICNQIKIHTPGSYYCPDHQVVCNAGQHPPRMAYACQYTSSSDYETLQNRRLGKFDQSVDSRRSSSSPPIYRKSSSSSSSSPSSLSSPSTLPIEHDNLTPIASFTAVSEQATPTATSLAMDSCVSSNINKHVPSPLCLDEDEYEDQDEVEEFDSRSTKYHHPPHRRSRSAFKIRPYSTRTPNRSNTFEQNLFESFCDQVQRSCRDTQRRGSGVPQYEVVGSKYKEEVGRHVHYREEYTQHGRYYNSHYFEADVNDESDTESDADDHDWWVNTEEYRAERLKELEKEQRRQRERNEEQDQYIKSCLKTTPQSENKNKAKRISIVTSRQSIEYTEESVTVGSSSITSTSASIATTQYYKQSHVQSETIESEDEVDCDDVYDSESENDEEPPTYFYDQPQRTGSHQFSSAYSSNNNSRANQLYSNCKRPSIVTFSSNDGSQVCSHSSVGPSSTRSSIVAVSANSSTAAVQIDGTNVCEREIGDGDNSEDEEEEEYYDFRSAMQSVQSLQIEEEEEQEEEESANIPQVESIVCKTQSRDINTMSDEEYYNYLLQSSQHPLVTCTAARAISSSSHNSPVSPTSDHPYTFPRKAGPTHKKAYSFGAALFHHRRNSAEAPQDSSECYAVDDMVLTNATTELPSIEDTLRKFSSSSISSGGSLYHSLFTPIHSVPPTPVDSHINLSTCSPQAPLFTPPTPNSSNKKDKKLSLSIPLSNHHHHRHHHHHHHNSSSIAPLSPLSPTSPLQTTTRPKNTHSRRKSLTEKVKSYYNSYQLKREAKKQQGKIVY